MQMELKNGNIEANIYIKKFIFASENMEHQSKTNTSASLRGSRVAFSILSTVYQALSFPPLFSSLPSAQTA